MKASKVVQGRDVKGLDLIKVTDTRSLVTVEYEDWAEVFSIAEARMLVDAIEIAWDVSRFEARSWVSSFGLTSRSGERRHQLGGDGFDDIQHALSKMEGRR